MILSFLTSVTWRVTQHMHNICLSIRLEYDALVQYELQAIGKKIFISAYQKNKEEIEKKGNVPVIYNEPYEGYVFCCEYRHENNELYGFITICRANKKIVKQRYCIVQFNGKYTVESF